MRTKFERLIAITVGVCVVAMISYWLVQRRMSPASRAELDAQMDLAQGHFEVISSGKPHVEFESRYVGLLWDRYRLQVKHIGCYVNSEMGEYMPRYNVVMMGAMRSRHGKDVFEECSRDAWAQLERR